MTNSRPARLLIVDDNEMNRDMLARRLLRKGYVVGLAENAKELLERVKQDAVDLVLLDIEMPDISGLDALQALRERYSAADLPIIMVTAKAQSDDIVKALDLGANDYLTKPIDFPGRKVKNAMPWRLVAPTMAYGTGICRPMLCISPLAGSPCWAIRKAKSGTDLKNGLTGSMTRIEAESKRRLLPIKKA